MFKVTITDPAYADGKPIELPVPRTGLQVEELRKKYARVDAEPIEPTEQRIEGPPSRFPSYPLPMSPDVKRLEPTDFQAALAALIRLYTSANKRGDQGLARRAEEATAALLGTQKHLKGDDEKPFNGTLAGLGR
jgi:hypothetical protein